MGRTLSDDWEQAASRDREVVREHRDAQTIRQFNAHYQKLDELRNLTDDERRARGMYVPEKRAPRKRRKK
jgi:hypothetical protein